MTFEEFRAMVSFGPKLNPAMQPKEDAQSIYKDAGLTREDVQFGPALNSAMQPPEGMPSIYAGSIVDPGGTQKWADYRALQARQSQMTPQQMEQAVKYYAPTAGSDMDSVAKAVETSVIMAQLLQEQNAGAGRGFTNPAPVDPSAPAPDTVQGQDSINQGFPKAFQKSPPTGKVNTEGGVDRVNARTSEHGVTATVGADGKIYMTNIGPDGQVRKGTGSPNSVLGNGMGSRNPAISGSSAVAPNTPLALNQALKDLSGSQDYDQARALMGNITQGIELARQKLNEEALNFAATKVGLPGLEAQLQQSMAADRNDPMWYPGIGDSPITQQLRVQITQSQNAARAVAQDYLNKNVNAAALNAAENTAKAEMKRIDNLGQRKLNAQMESDVRTAQRAAVKIEKAEEVASNLSPEDISRLAILSPSNKGSNTDLANYYIQNAASSKGKLDEAIFAPTDTDLALSAASDNRYALTILAAKEGLTPEETKKRLDKIRADANSPDFDKRNIDNIVKNLPEDQRVERKKQLLAEASMARTAGKDEETKKQRLKYALEMHRAQQTEGAAADMSQLFSKDGPMGPALTKAKNVTGNYNLDSVLTAFLEGSAGPERMQRLSNFNKYMHQSVAKLPQSIFGVPDATKLTQMVAAVQAQPTNSRVTSPFVLN